MLKTVTAVAHRIRKCQSNNIKAHIYLICITTIIQIQQTTAFSKTNNDLLRENTNLIRKKSFHDNIIQADFATKRLKKLSGTMNNFSRKYGNYWVVSKEDQNSCYLEMINDFGLLFEAATIEQTFEDLALGFTFKEKSGVLVEDLEFVYDVFSGCLKNTSMSSNLGRTDLEFDSYLETLEPIGLDQKVEDLNWSLSQGCFVTFFEKIIFWPKNFEKFP